MKTRGPSAPRRPTSPGTFEDGGPHDEARLAEGDLVADARPERHEQRLVDDGAARLGEAAPLAGRRRLDRAP